MAMTAANISRVHPGEIDTPYQVVLFPDVNDAALKSYSDDRVLVKGKFYTRANECWKDAYGRETNSLLNQENMDGTIGTYMDIEYPWNNALGQMTMSLDMYGYKIVIRLGTVGDLTSSENVFEFISLSVGDMTVYNLEDYAYDDFLGLGLQLVPHPTVDYDSVASNLCQN